MPKSFDLKVLHCRANHLGESWKAHVIQGTFWRYCVSSGPGAGIWVNKQKIEIQPRQIYLFPPLCDLLTWQEKDPFFFYIHFVAPPFYNRPQQPYYTFPISSHCRKQIKQIGGTTHQRISDDNPHALLQAITLSSTALAQVPYEDFMSHNEDRKMAEIMDEIRNSYQKEYCIEELAAKCGMCPDVFIRRFKTYAGTTPYQYLLSSRISTAAYLLENTHQTIEEIAELVGFNDRFHFSQTFKTRTKVAPGKYRRMMQSSR